jgi:hypothetical protein
MTTEWAEDHYDDDENALNPTCACTSKSASLVCNQPERAYEVAQAGMQLCDNPRVRFGQFHKISSIFALPLDNVARCNLQSLAGAALSIAKDNEGHQNRAL